MQALAPGMGPVAVHRWLARGEDWAMHPFFSPHTVEVLRALDERIKGRVRGPFQVEAAGGVLVGELLDDPDCLDPRARERHPCVVRLAFSPGPLSPPEQDRVLAYLRALPLPAVPGIDSALLVNVPHVRPIARRSVDVLPEKEPGRVNWWIWVLIVLAVCSLAFVAWLGVTKLLGPAERDKPPGSKVKEGGKVDPGPSAGLLERYARVEHPYVVFLRQHPEAMNRPRRAEEESYEAWRRKQGAFRDRDHPLPRGLRGRVAAWRELDETLDEVAREMKRLREKWGGKEDVAYPVEEIDAFFAELVRPEGLRPREEFDHPGNVFLWRLPGAPVGAGRTFEDEKELRPVLGELLRRLSGRRVDARWGSRELLSRVAAEMDYKAWREGQSDTVFVDEGQESEVVKRELKRFGG